MVLCRTQLASPFEFNALPLIAVSAEVDSPSDDSQILRLQITSGPNGTGWIIFRSESGTRYQLQASSLSEPSEWIPASDIFVARGDISKCQISLAPGTYFYRVAKLGAVSGETTPVSAAPILAGPDSSTQISQSSQNRRILSSDLFVAATSENRSISFTPLILADDDGSGPSDWVAKVEWLLKNAPLIAHPL